MKQFLIITTIILSGVLYSFAQNTSFENVYNIKLRNSDAIKEGSDVKGYYFFYESDKIDHKTNEYTIRVTDHNLLKIKDIKFTGSRDISLLESAFNGTDLVFLFYNDDTRILDYQVYGVDGKKNTHTPGN